MLICERCNKELEEGTKANVRFCPSCVKERKRIATNEWSQRRSLKLGPLPCKVCGNPKETSKRASSQYCNKCAAEQAVKARKLREQRKKEKQIKPAVKTNDGTKFCERCGKAMTSKGSKARFCPSCVHSRSREKSEKMALTLLINHMLTINPDWKGKDHCFKCNSKTDYFSEDSSKVKSSAHYTKTYLTCEQCFSNFKANQISEQGKFKTCLLCGDKIDLFTNETIICGDCEEKIKLKNSFLFCKQCGQEKEIDDLGRLRCKECASKWRESDKERIEELASRYKASDVDVNYALKAGKGFCRDCGQKITENKRHNAFYCDPCAVIRKKRADAVSWERRKEARKSQHHTCKRCNKEVIAQKGVKRAIYCDKCAEIQKKESIARSAARQLEAKQNKIYFCERCESPITSGLLKSTYCPECRVIINKAKAEKQRLENQEASASKKGPCVVCGKPIPVGSLLSKYCSHECRDIHNKKSHVCRRCKEVITNVSPKAWYCEKCYTEKLNATSNKVQVCRDCKEIIVGENKNTQYCKICRLKKQEAASRNKVQICIDCKEVIVGRSKQALYCNKCLKIHRKANQKRYCERDKAAWVKKALPCRVCGQPVPTDTKNRVFCSKECLAINSGIVREKKRAETLAKSKRIEGDDKC